MIIILFNLYIVNSPDVDILFFRTFLVNFRLCWFGLFLQSVSTRAFITQLFLYVSIITLRNEWNKQCRDFTDNSSVISTKLEYSVQFLTRQFARFSKCSHEYEYSFSPVKKKLAEGCKWYNSETVQNERIGTQVWVFLCAKSSFFLLFMTNKFLRLKKHDGGLFFRIKVINELYKN